jgi:hypothetical protein
MNVEDAFEIINNHIKDLDSQIDKTVDKTNLALLHQAKSTALLSLAKILVG